MPMPKTTKREPAAIKPPPRKPKPRPRPAAPGGWEATGSAGLDLTAVKAADGGWVSGREPYPLPVDPPSRSSYLDGDRYTLVVERLPGTDAPETEAT